MKLFKNYKTFDEIRPIYLAEKKITLQPKTYIGHNGKTALFGKWLKDNYLSDKSLRKITNQNIHDFFIYLADKRDLDKATCIKYNDTLQVFFKFAMALGEIEKLPFNNIPLPLKKRDHKPKYIPEDKILALLNDIKENDPQLFIGCMIQYCSAIRPGREMLNIKPTDIDFRGMSIKVGRLNSKTDKQRYADLTDELAQYLIKYGVKEANPNHYLFGKRRTFGSVHICENNLTCRFNKYRDTHEIDKGVKFYSWKHTGGTDIINQKLASLKQLQHHFGHANISSTEQYVVEHDGLTNEVIKKEFKSPCFVQEIN